MTISLRAALGVALVWLAALHGPSPVAAQTPTAPTFEHELRVGFNGAYKLGKWTELEVTLVGGPAVCTGVVRVETPDGTGAAYTTGAPQPLRLLPGQRSQVVVPICLGGPDAPVRVTFDYKTDAGSNGSTAINFGPDDRTKSLPVPLPNPTPLVLHLGPSIGLKEAVARQKWPTDAEPQVALVESTQSLPQRWYGYDGVDLIVLSSAAPELYDALSDAQREALFDWIRRGGRVLLSGGASAPQLFAAGRPLADLAPGRFDRIYSLTSSRALEDFSESTQRLFPTAETRLDVSVFEGDAGKVIASEKGAVPLVTRRALNYGEVIFVSADLHNRLFIDWSGLDQFYNRLLGWRPVAETQTDEPAPNAAFMQQHITDLATDLRISLEKFDVWPPPFMLVVGMILVYILLIGPGDYFFLKRLGRMELTWVTFPAIVVLVSVAAYWTARTSRGDKLKVNQVNVVDIDVNSKTARGTTVANIFAPYSSTYNLTLEPALPRDPAAPVAPPAASTLLTWFGLPEDRAFGGMGNRNSRPILGSAPYDVQPDQGKVSGVPILTASTKAFIARWTQPADLFDAKLTLQNDKNSGDVLGELSLVSRFNIPLESLVLYYGTDSYDLEDMTAGGRWSGPLSSLNRQSLTDRLTDMRQVVDPTRNTYVYQRRPYAVAAGHEEDVLTAMMFYSSVAGFDYTRLSNEYMNFLDLSHQLECGRAMIVAVARTPSAGLSNDGKSLADSSEVHDYTVYRFLVDVTKQK